MKSSYLRRLGAQLLALCLAATQVAQTAQAAATDIADIPMAVKNAAAPNIMFTLDDSGSMQWEVLPDAEISQNITSMYPTNQGYYGSSYYKDCGFFVVTFPFITFVSVPCVGGHEDNNIHHYRRRSSYTNKVYYNPTVRYRPWSNADGSSMANASPTAAYNNPADTTKGSRNLTVINDGDANTSTDSYGAWRRWDSTNGYQWYYGKYVSAETGTAGYWPAVYFVFNAANAGCTTVVANQANDRSCYTKVEIRTTTTSYTKYSGRTDCAGSTCTYTEEMQNFANWYQYYRSRVLTARAGIGRAFSQMGTDPRVGFAAINKGSATIDGVTSPGAVVNGVRQFSGTDRTAFFTSLYGHNIPASGTPLRRALDDVGKYFERSDNSGPYSLTPGTSNATAHAQCRQNYTILMSDGYWNGDQAPTAGAQGNVDGNNGTTITGPNSQSFQYLAARPYTDAWSGTLADVAMYYWYRDLRTDLANKVQPNSADPAFWQHMVTFTVGLGVVGDLDPATDLPKLSACTAPSTPAGCETKDWPQASSGLEKPNVDDMWHAAVNSRGGFFSASNPDEFASSLAAALSTILGRTGAAAAVAVANAQVTSTDNASYQSKYNSGDWTGELEAHPVNVTTGVVDETVNLWISGNAQAQLDARSSASRYIVSFSGTTPWNGASFSSQGIQFQPTTAATTTKLSAAQQTLLNTTVTPPGPTDGAAVLGFLRGDNYPTGGDYRSRSHLLGDIINAEPVVIRKPNANYADECYGAPVTGKCTQSFKAAAAANANRIDVIAQGANDGMLHFFNATIDSLTNLGTTSSGREEWAYVPNLVMGQLNNLSRKIGFVHKYYVDATGVAGDVDFCNTKVLASNGNVISPPSCTAPDWRTIYVSGLGKGGRGYFALDVTSTKATSEANAASKVLWEMPHSGTASGDKVNVGYGFGRPILVKTQAMGWVVLVASGYNNGADTTGDGHGRLFVLSPRSGEVLKSIDTGVGSSTDPSGLAHLSAYVENADIDNTTDYVYGGDLLGNVWRFDLSGNNANQWDVKKLATLVDSGGAAQPVTTEPELAKVRVNSSDKRFVYVGTGKYLGDSDVSTSQTQTMYGLIDNQGNSPTISPLRSNLQQQTLVTSGNQRTFPTVVSPDYTTKKGWYVDMPQSGERMNTNAQLALGALIFTSNVPSTDPCDPGGSSWFNVLDYKTGGKLAQSSSTIPPSKSLGNALASRVVVIQLPNGDVKVIIRMSDATTKIEDPGEPPTSTTGRRISWREVLQN